MKINLESAYLWVTTKAHFISARCAGCKYYDLSGCSRTKSCPATLELDTVRKYRKHSEEASNYEN